MTDEAVPTERSQDSTQVTCKDAEEQARLEEWRRKRARRREQQQEATSSEDALLQLDASELPADVRTDVKRRKLEEDALLLQSQNSIMSQRRKQAIEALRRSTGAETATDREAFPLMGNQSQPPERSQETIETTVKDDENNHTTVVTSLLDQAAALQQSMTAAEREHRQRQEEEQRILREASQVQTNALQAASEIATGTVYSKPMPSTWTVPQWILRQGPTAWDAIRKEWHMDVEGVDVPPPVKRFVDLKLPAPILHYLQHKKNIQRPTPIQMQGLPVALAGRDMVGIAFTGSGKTLAFGLPLIMAALEEELRMPLIAGEGPVGIILAPSRELARQTFDLIVELADALRQDSQYPELRAQLLIGGESLHDQLRVVRERGVHAICATPGRLRDVLKRRAMTLQICRYICLDEADRMLDMVSCDYGMTIIMSFSLIHNKLTQYIATFSLARRASMKKWEKS